MSVGPWGRSRGEDRYIQAAPVSPQTEPQKAIGPAQVSFLGNRITLMAILLRGYLLTLLTAGIYRFWLVTQKRRFYWSNTLIDGHPLEYTGRSIQLLIGFLLAILVFIPLYGGAFYLTTVFYEFAAFAYIGMFVVLYFLAGYAMYRGRRFRLTRTLWRGIRFGQTGSAWGYAVRRFLWSIATILTLGLAYPLMTASLYKYRFANTWFGDRKFDFSGRARDVLGPFLIVYVIIAVAVILFAVAVATPAYQAGLPAPAILPTMLVAIVGPILLPWLRARIETRMLSSINIGEAKLSVTIKARAFYGQYFIFGLLTSVMSFLFMMTLGFVIQALEAGALTGLIENFAFFGRGIGTLLLFAIAYLAVLATYALLWDVIISFGYWKIVARGAVIENIESLRSVGASHEESPNIGEGLADALNVGAY